MENHSNLEIGEGSLPIGHSLLLHQNKNRTEGLRTTSIPRSHLFSALDSFLPEFMQSCDQMQQEIAETGENRYCIEEEIDSEMESGEESSDSSDSSSDSNLSHSSQSGCMEVENSDNEDEEKQIPIVEMKFAMAPLETVDLIKSMEEKLPNPVEEASKGSLVTEL